VALVVAFGDWPTCARECESPRQREIAATMTADVDPIYFVGHISPRPLLMQSGKTDHIIPPVVAEQLHTAAREPKSVRWYPGDHGDPIRSCAPDEPGSGS
jgi:hypothetical protein